MAFKVAATRRVVWPVTVSFPQDGGTTKKERFELEFQVLTIGEQEKAIAEGRDLLEEAVVGWPDERGPKDEHDQRVAYSDAARAELLAINHVRAAIFAALGEINSGRAAARKN